MSNERIGVSGPAWEEIEEAGMCGGGGKGLPALQLAAAIVRTYWPAKAVRGCSQDLMAENQELLDDKLTQLLTE